ncbi:Aldehyde dehydrogenase family [Popillia japonica]|uniref:Aldehyde dehydrogenase n=1 Tax=Popillia japonica TaxID=7064 RepID=A0AAW1IVG9_POPJA
MDRSLARLRQPMRLSKHGKTSQLDASDAAVAIEAANEAFKTWQNVTADQRSALLRKWSELIQANLDELASILSAENGKSLNDAKFETTITASSVADCAEEAKRIKGEIVSSPMLNSKLRLQLLALRIVRKKLKGLREKSSQAHIPKCLIERQPIGVVGLITPWNFPLLLTARRIATALAAGCTCVVKPSEDTPLSTLSVIQLAQDAGVPEGVINVLTCDRTNAAQIGKALCESPLIAGISFTGSTVVGKILCESPLIAGISFTGSTVVGKILYQQCASRIKRLCLELGGNCESPLIAGISFTGSTVVGKILYQQCASRIKRLCLELGGNAPFLVFNSANIDKAVETAVRTKFVNCGQVCISINRILVQEDVYDQFLAKLTQAFKAVIPGENLQPLINETQFKRVCGIVEEAKSRGANIVTGGQPAKEAGELFYQPTLITNVTKDMQVYKDEIFGPVVSVTKFKTEEEGVAMAVDTEKGLASYFFSQDVAQIFRVSRLLQSGTVAVNDGMGGSPLAPFGGIKESGIGKEGSQYGIDECCYIKSITIGDL